MAVFFLFGALCVPVVAPLEDQEVERALLPWFVSAGGEARGVEIADFGEIGRGLRCTVDIAARESVLRVPEDIVLSGVSARRLLGIEARDEDAIAVLLLAERARGERSRWAPYLAALPEEVATLKSLDDDELAWLQDERLAARGRQSREALLAAAARVAPLLRRAVRDACDDDACVERYASARAYAWARGIIDSRALTFRGARYLVPVADLVNYGPHPRAADREYDAGSFFLEYHRFEGGSLRTFADRPCAKGEQLVEDYGDNSNLVYLEHHGFVPSANPFDCVRLELPPLEDATGAERARIEYLKAAGDRGPPSSCVRSRLAAAPVALRRYLAATAMDATRAAECRAALDEWCREPPIDQVAKPLCDAAAATLAAYPTTLAFDDEMLNRSAALSRGSLLALRYRRSQKAVLATLLGDCEALLEQRCDDTEAVVAAAKLGTLEKRVEAFNSWAKNESWPELEIEARILPSHGGRLGAVASRPITKQQPYIGIPESACLTARHARDDPTLGPALEDKFDDFHAMLFLLLREVFALVEVDDGDWRPNLRGPWAPYLALLPGVDDVLRCVVERRALGRGRRECRPPERGSAPLLWADDDASATDAARRWLRGSASEHAVLSYFRSVRRTWGATATAFRATPRLRANFGGDADLAVSWPVYRWAVHTLDSRSIWWNGNRNLVPMLDLVNAAATDDMPPAAPVHRTVLDDRGVAVTRAAASFGVGEQVLEDYGQPNHVLFLYHGFALPVNKHDCVRLDLVIPLLDDDDAAAALYVKRRLAAHSFSGPFLAACVKPHMPPRMAHRLYSFLAIKHDHELPLPSRPPGLELLLALADELKVRLANYSIDTLAAPDLPLGAKVLLASERQLLIELYEEIIEKSRERESPPAVSATPLFDPW
ncbi:hypothetical protein CTAYLR_000877 [Chrysophaeum taylorii]|uniref:SET domain-containing protein n=1 Tax=Chrysophaeum taylorii TaxID=2483200 RepID=A0AAD7XNR9_9STRA|nr:hypothetical protein CTAYLR_000877 [Chrysophaeum taylorii]